MWRSISHRVSTPPLNPGRGKLPPMPDESPEARPAVAESAFRLSLLKDPLEILGKAAAALLVIFYILGFLVVSAANYKHGITNFGLFRVRVVSAGVLAALFSGAAFWLWEGAFGLGTRVEAASRPLVLKILKFLIAARFTAFFLNALIYNPPLSKYAGWRVILYMFSVAVLTVPAVTPKKYPVTFSIIRWITVFTLVAAEIAFQWKTGADYIFIWFVFFAFLADTTKTSFKLVSTLRDVNWLTLVTDLAIVPIFFGLMLYERIPPRFGGGKPVPVVFQFAGTSPVDGAAKDKFWLVDEGDSGFYVLQAPEDKKGIFLPRSSIAAIYYDAGSDASRLPSGNP